MYVIRSMSMMHYLVREGFTIRKFERSNDNPDHVVFLFDETDELKEAMTRYTDLMNRTRV